MLKWAIWEGDRCQWDALLLRFLDYNVYQSYGWGEHKRRLGWTPHRLVATEGSLTIAAAQVLLRRFPFGIVLAWVPGGPIGPVDKWGRTIQTAIRSTTRARHLYCRLSPMRKQLDEDLHRLISSGWQRPDARMSSGISFEYSLCGTEAERRMGASGNWRHNLRRASRKENSAGLWVTPDSDEFMHVYSAMESYKGLEEQISRNTLVSILTTFGNQCILVRCDDARGRLLALRGALVWGDKGWDMFAATTPEGRKVYASYGAFWELMRQCAARGITWYDMSGADPVGNKGVYDFKKGTGANEFRYLGEWEWATSSLLRHAVNLVVKRRAGTF